MFRERHAHERLKNERQVGYRVDFELHANHDFDLGLKGRLVDTLNAVYVKS
jgi:hypothetical protein